MSAGIVTDSGLANVMAAWAASTSRPQYLQYGTGSGQSETDTDLATPVQTRVLGTTSQETTNVTDDTYRITGTITADAVRAITECGVFDASSGGDMDVYGEFDVINLAAGDAITFQVSVTVSRAT